MSKFPEIEYFGVWMREYRPPNQFGYPDDTVRDWFKRCIEDTPSAYLSVPWKEWFKKWFSQFIENHEDDEK